jgi:hypothetical protein
VTQPSGSSGGNFVEVQVLLPAPKNAEAITSVFLCGKSSRKLPPQAKTLSFAKQASGGQRFPFCEAILYFYLERYNEKSLYHFF